MKTFFLFLSLLLLCGLPAHSDRLKAPAKDVKQLVSEGGVSGTTYVAKFGANPLITTASAPEDVWEFGGEYTDSAYGTGIGEDIGVADIVSLSSSDAADTQLVLIFGLTGDGYSSTQFATLNGQNTVTLVTPLWRIWRVENWSSTSFSGTVYVYSGTDQSSGVPNGSSVVKAVVDDGNNQTQMAVYTIPRGKVGFLKRAEIGLGATAGGPLAGPEQATFSFKARLYRQVYKVKKTVYLVTTACSEHSDERFYPDPLPALTDVKLTVSATTEDTAAWGTFHILLVDEDKFSSVFLNRIQQPTF